MEHLRSLLLIIVAELRRSLKDLKRIRHDDKHASNRRSCTARLTAEGMPDPQELTQWPRKPRQELHASVPIVARSVISRPTRSMERSPFSPPPRVSFDWWRVPESAAQVDNNNQQKQRHKKKQNILVEKLQESDRQSRKEAAERERMERRAARQEEKLARQAAQQEKKQAQEAARQAAQEEKKQAREAAKRQKEEARLENERKRHAAAEERAYMRRYLEHLQERRRRQAALEAQQAERARLERRRGILARRGPHGFTFTHYRTRR